MSAEAVAIKVENQEYSFHSATISQNIHIVHQPQQKQVNAGIYFNNTSFQLSVYSLPPNNQLTSPSKAQSCFTEIATVSPEICFYNKSILIGQEAQTYRFRTHSSANKIYRYFDIIHLLTFTDDTQACNFDIYIKNIKYTLCHHEIIAIFLKQLFNFLEDSYPRSNVNILKVVITTSLTLSSAAKERLRDSIHIAGCRDVRIKSTLLTTAIATLENYSAGSAYYKEMQWLRSGTTLKYIVLDIQEVDSFSVGVVEINPSAINVKYLFGSYKNLNGKQHVELDPHLQVHAQKTLETICSYIISISKNVLFDGIVVNTNNKFPRLQTILYDVLSEKGILVNSTLGGNSLLGAALIASSSTNTSSILPSNIKLNDIRAHELRLSVIDCSGVRTDVVNINIDKLKPIEECVFTKTFHIPLMFSFKNSVQDTAVVVIELHELCQCQSQSQCGHQKSEFQVCRYQLTITCESQNMVGKLVQFSFGRRKVCQLILNCFVDADGIYTLRADHHSEFPLGLQMQRIDSTSCSCGNSSTSDYKNVISICNKIV